MVRTPSKTGVHHGEAISCYNSGNDIEEAYIQFKVFGEEPELYEIANFE